MQTPQDPPPPRPPGVSFARRLIERRVPYILAIYAGASWALVEFTAFATDEFLLSPHWTRLVLLTLLLALPSVVMLAWFHGKPGKDRDSLARTEKIGIPANALLCAAALWMLFDVEDLGSATASVTVETEGGETIERVVPKSAFRKSTALFPLALGSGIGEDEAWVSYAVPEALALDLMADDFFAPVTFHGYDRWVRERGFESFAAAPLALRRELAQERYAGFMATGEIDRADQLFRATLRLYRVDDGSLAGESTHEGSDLLAIVDEMSPAVKQALEIPSREGVEDLPVRARLSENDAAVEAFFRGIHQRYADWDSEAAIEFLTDATTLDPSFTVAHYVLAGWLQGPGDREAEAVASLMAAMQNLYRMPERYGFQVKADYYHQTGETDLAATVVEMWVELYPGDLDALRRLVQTRWSVGDLEGVLATLDSIRSLDPLDGSVLLDMALAHEQLGQNDQVLAALTEYVERFPGEAAGYMDLAAFHRRHGRHDDARERLERAIVLDPLTIGLVLLLADLDLDMGRLDEARAAYERLLAQARTPSQRSDALRGLTRYHRRRGEMAAAIGAMEARAEELAAYRSPLGVAYGMLEHVPVYLDAGRVDEAAALLEELRAAMQTPWIPANLLRLTVPVSLAAEGVEAAREAHRQLSEAVQEGDAVHLRPNMLADLGLIQEREGDYDRAAGNFRAAVALSPEASHYRGAGRALRKAGRLDEAEDEMREALRLIPADPLAHLEMALVLEGKGDVEGALDHLRSALEVWENADADYEPAREARAKLAELGG